MLICYRACFTRSNTLVGRWGGQRSVSSLELRFGFCLRLNVFNPAGGPKPISAKVTSRSEAALLGFKRRLIQSPHLQLLPAAIRPSLPPSRHCRGDGGDGRWWASRGQRGGVHPHQEELQGLADHKNLWERKCPPAGFFFCSLVRSQRRREGRMRGMRAASRPVCQGPSDGGAGGGGGEL